MCAQFGEALVDLLENALEGLTNTKAGMEALIGGSAAVHIRELMMEKRDAQVITLDNAFVAKPLEAPEVAALELIIKGLDPNNHAVCDG